MAIHSEGFSLDCLQNADPSTLHFKSLLASEIQGVETDFNAVKGPAIICETACNNAYQIILALAGAASVVTRQQHQIVSASIIRIPFNCDHKILVRDADEFYFLRIRKAMDQTDIESIKATQHMHGREYVRSISDCPTYNEDIKSESTINRMLLPQGFVPRLCMGSVETIGPDVVAAHTHPMLDQLFLGLKNCNCTCYADDAQAHLSENTLLHIPLGSRHSVSVHEADLLSYIWLDFFFSLEGEKYLNEHHKMNDE